MIATERIWVPKDAVLKAPKPPFVPTNRLSKRVGNVLVHDGTAIDTKKLDAQRVEKLVAKGTLVQSKEPPPARERGAIVGTSDGPKRVKPPKKTRKAKAKGGKQ